MDNVRDLIAAGRLEDALDILAKSNQDAILLKARFSTGKRQYSMGLVDFSEWQRVQNQVAYAVLELMDSSKKPELRTGKVETEPTKPLDQEKTPQRKVFISYNHKDKAVADKIKSFLEERGVKVTIDRSDMEPGSTISSFIQESIRDNHFILSIVSENSLRSGWVGKESTAAFFAEWLADKHFIPVFINPTFFEPKFYIDSLKLIKEQENELKKHKEEADALQGDGRFIQDDIDRLYDLKTNLGKILQHLKSVLVVDVSDECFDEGMQKVYSRITKVE